jgi:uncharacterized membrane protein
VLEDNPELSRWKLATGGLEFTWLSRILKLVPQQIIQWESVDGLPNRGAIRFYDRQGSSIVKMTVSYAIPGFLGQLMDNLFLGRVVESTIQADLAAFCVLLTLRLRSGTLTLLSPTWLSSCQGSKTLRIILYSFQS